MSTFDLVQTNLTSLGPLDSQIGSWVSWPHLLSFVPHHHPPCYWINGSIVANTELQYDINDVCYILPTLSAFTTVAFFCTVKLAVRSCHANVQ